MVWENGFKMGSGSTVKTQGLENKEKLKLKKTPQQPQLIFELLMFFFCFFLEGGQYTHNIFIYTLYTFIDHYIWRCSLLFSFFIWKVVCNVKNWQAATINYHKNI